jgi:hypothetical protein
MTACPHCHGTGQVEPERDRIAELRAWLTDKGHWVGPSGAVTEAAAAAALDRSPSTLRGWRYTDQRLPFKKQAGRVRYALADLAAFAAGEIK